MTAGGWERTQALDLLARGDLAAAAQLAGSNGLWAACRDAARAADTALLDDLERSGVVEFLDDELPAAQPSAGRRAAALIAAARLFCWDGTEPAQARAWAAAAVEAFSPPGAPRWTPPEDEANARAAATAAKPGHALVNSLAQQAHPGLWA
ncbi:MAG: hypothetical protein ACKVWR_03050, partial [Acidimicrobiales bacterium]